MKTKYYLIFLALLLSFGFSSNAIAQRCLTFKYDADGNRVGRAMKTNCMEVRGEAEALESGEAWGEMRVYPNPNNGSFKVIMPESIKHDNACYELYDVNGLMIANGVICDIETDIDIGNHSAGVYLLRIVNGDDVISEIILKQ